ncbi:GNAT family N-acetyltransferase [candidate division CSSED10-310 bacterium]|uniref:GNAT family N-acetyltransferase n=1 Tax=candidate division CSSED10-310 bacterium TaxID=2855610 RepID=A0ABV6Z4U7_UNCC1
MSADQLNLSSLKFQPLIPARWSDFEQLFGEKGAYGGCWCMYWRITRSQFEKQQGPENREAMREIVNSGEIPGILAYFENRPIGWCAIAPRENYSSLNRSFVLKRIDDLPVWSIVCFFIDKKYRGRGIGLFLIHAAIDYVRREGGEVIEAYPTRPRKGSLPPVSSYMGLPGIFSKAGFVECKRPSKAKIIMRYSIEN